MPAMPNETATTETLNHNDATVRRQALNALCESRPRAWPAENENVNMHIHSFFSFNAEGWSPTRIAWEARQAGLYAAALCDFDTLDGLDEFLAAGRDLGLRAAVSIETRSYVDTLADAEISSPGEPGVAYVMGLGFGERPSAGTPAATGLSNLRARADQRNRALVQRVNAALPAIAIDYDADAVTLMPGGLPTERQLVRAYLRKSRQVFPVGPDFKSFWAETLAMTEDAMHALTTDEAAFEEKARARLVKRGGLGYEAPSPQTFPATRAFMDWVRACGALPAVAWLDGTSAGEADAREYLRQMREQGAAALNIVPDRNWNIADPALREVKTRKLRETVAAAEDLGFPINIGTEMNRRGLPFCDDLNGDALRPYKEIFRRGARIVIGQTRLARWADYPYGGEQAQQDFASVQDRNRFFANVGAGPAFDAATEAQLERQGPRQALDWFRARAKQTDGNGA